MSKKKDIDEELKKLIHNSILWLEYSLLLTQATIQKLSDYIQKDDKPKRKSIEH